MPGSQGDKRYFVRDRGRVSGPFDEDTLTRFAKTRRLARHHQISTDRIQWLPATAVLPGLFPRAGDPPAQPEQPDYGLVDLSTESSSMDEFLTQPTLPPGSGRGRFPVGALVIGLAVVALLTAGTAIILAVQQRRPWTEARFRDDAAARVVVVQGLRGSKGKRQMLGLALGRNHLVMPVEAAELGMIKVESGNVSQRAWHSAMLQVVDLQAGLSGARADLGQAQKYFTPESDDPQPTTDDTLFVVGRLVAANAGKSEPFVLEGGLSSWQNRGGPDERLVVELHKDPPGDAILLGAAVLDPFGRLSGMVNATPEVRLVACSPVSELATKRRELRKMPADFSIDPIELPETPVAREPMPTGVPATQPPATQPPATQPPATQPPATQPPATQPPATQPPATQPPTGKQTSGDQPTQTREPVNGAADLVDTLGSLGERALNQTSDSMLPPLDKETADRLGRETLAEILSAHPRCKNKLILQRVGALFKEMVIAAEMSPEDLTLTVTEDETNNAFSFVGGNVVITTGFMAFAGSDDDLVRFVISHELGHISLGHTDLPYRRQQAAGDASVIAHVGEGLIGMSPISQAQERDADCFAVRSLRRVNRSVEGGIRFFERIAEQDTAEDADDASRVLLGSMFGSHPDSRRRIEHIRHGCDDRQP